VPLPTGVDADKPWPPRTAAQANETYARWAAWYSGDPDKLAQAYQGSLSTADDAKGYDERAAGAFARSRERTFWGRPRSPGDNQLRTARMHVPLAADLAATSADLLFGESPTLYVPDESATSTAEGAAPVRKAHRPTQDRIDKAVEEQGIQAVLLEAGEIAAAYGGVYLRVMWDTAVADMPFFDAITPDHAVPEWRSGRLSGVTFWKILPPLDSDQHGVVWRHLERHETGRILHGLYKGTDDKLGDPRPLKEREETRLWAEMSAGGTIATGARRLAVDYIPNMLPHRHTPGSPLGRSDYDGIEGPLDALDETWTSWLRDIRLGKGRLIVPDEYTRHLGRGKGAVFDPEQEIYQTVTAMPGNDGIDMELVQFAIRVAEHKETALSLTAVACRGAGYSVQTFGEQAAEGAAQTATEVTARTDRSAKTRARKIGYWAPALRRLLLTYIEIDLAQFKPDGVQPITPRVEFPDAVAKDPEALGRVVQLMFAAEAASLHTRVKTLNPDWSDDQIEEEVQRIKDEAKEAMPEIPPPGQFGAVDAGPKPPAGGGSGGSPAGGSKPPTSKKPTAKEVR
jgi:hypothetical protein